MPKVKILYRPCECGDYPDVESVIDPTTGKKAYVFFCQKCLISTNLNKTKRNAKLEWDFGTSGKQTNVPLALVLQKRNNQLSNQLSELEKIVDIAIKVEEVSGKIYSALQAVIVEYRGVLGSALRTNHIEYAQLLQRNIDFLEDLCLQYRKAEGEESQEENEQQTETKD